jgi:hypothetical protein
MAELLWEVFFAHEAEENPVGERCIPSHHIKPVVTDKEEDAFFDDMLCESRAKNNRDFGMKYMETRNRIRENMYREQRIRAINRDDKKYRDDKKFL